MAGRRSHRYSAPLPFATALWPQRDDKRDSQSSQLTQIRVSDDSSNDSAQTQSLEQSSSQSRSLTSPSTNDSSLIVRKGTRPNSTDKESFSAVQRASGIYELAGQLGDYNAHQRSSFLHDSDGEDSAAPPPVALHPKDRYQAYDSDSEDSAAPPPVALQPRDRRPVNRAKVRFSPVAPAPNPRSGASRPKSSRSHEDLHLEVVRDGVSHHMTPDDGVFYEQVDGVQMDTQPSAKQKEKEPVSMAIPEIEARDVSKLPQAEHADEIMQRGRHTARPPPPVMQHRPSDGAAREISPRPAQKGTIHHLVDRYSSYAGTRLGKQGHSPTGMSHNEASGPAARNPSRPTNGGVNDHDTVASSAASTSHSSYSPPSSFNTIVSEPRHVSDGTRSGSRSSAQVRHGTPPQAPSPTVGANPTHSDAAPQHSKVSEKVHEKVSDISHSMSQKIAESAKAIEENLPWNRLRKSEDV